MDDSFLYMAFVFLMAAVISVPIASRLGLSSVLGYLVAGVIIGPFVLGFIGEEGEDIMHAAEFGVVMMLFLIGLELQPSVLWKMRTSVLGLGGLQVGLSAAVICAACMVFGMAFKPALAIGLILALSSTAIVVQSLNEKGWFKTSGGQAGFSILLFQDIAFIPILAMLPLLAPEVLDPELVMAAAPAAGGEAVGDPQPAWFVTLKVLVVLGGIVVVGRYVMRYVFRAIASTGISEVFTAAALALVIGVALLMNFIGLSPALGTFLAGVVLADSEYRHELESDVEPFKGLLLGLFFIAVGATVDFNLIFENPLTIALIVLGLMVGKAVVLNILGRIFGLKGAQLWLVTLGLSQGGEFGFVLFSYAGQLEVVSRDTLGLFVAAIAVTMALTPLLFVLYEKVILPRSGSNQSESDREPDEVEEQGSVIIVGFGRFGHLIGRMLRSKGIRPTIMDNDAEHIEFWRNLGFKVYFGDATRHELLTKAGAAEAKLLVITTNQHETNMRILEAAKKHFPKLKVFVSAAGRPETYALMEGGADRVFREYLGTSLLMGIESLQALGVRRFNAHRTAWRLMRYDEEHMQEGLQMWKDRPTYFKRAKERIEQFEEGELRQVAKEVAGDNEAWDPGKFVERTDVELDK